MNKSDFKLCLIFSGAALLLSSCATWSRHNTPESPGTPETQKTQEAQEAAEASKDPTTQKLHALEKENKQLQEALVSVTSKLDSMTSEMRNLNEKIDTNQSRMDNLTRNQRAKPAPVGMVTTEGASPLPPAGDVESESSFGASSGKAAVQKFRESMVLFEAHNFADSALSFSAFVEKYPDHPLAGSAQYFLGESYFRQQQYKLAARELQQVLTSFDHSTHIADTLLDLANSEEKIGNSEDAAQHRQLLTSLFPHSPAGAALLTNPESPPKVEAKTAPVPILLEQPSAQLDTIPKTNPNKMPEDKMPVEKASAEKAEGHGSELKSNPFPMEIVPAAKPKALSAPVSSTGLDSPPPTAPIEHTNNSGER